MIINFFYIFTLTIFFLLFFSKIAKYLKLIDYSDERKIHIGEIPLVGGLSIFLSIAISLFFIKYADFIAIIILCSAIIVLVGAIDDAIKLGVVTRLITLLVLSLMLIGVGIKVYYLGSYDLFPDVYLGIFSILFTVIAVIGLTNALNFIDGIDGLCASLSIIAISSLGIIFYIEDYYSHTNIILTYLAALLAFLIFNLGLFNTKKIFLGDSGSMFLGFTISWFLIYFANISLEPIHPVLVLWVVSIPIFDLVSVIFRRIIRGINPFKPDRRHIHHILIDHGISQKKSLFILIIIGLLDSFVGLSTYYFFNASYSLIVFIFFSVIYFILTLRLSRMQKL